MGRPGLSSRTTLIAAAAFSLLILGPALLKTRHLIGVAERAAWQPEEFEMGRAEFDRVRFEADPNGGTNHPIHPKTRELFALGMVDYLHADDRAAQARFLRAFAQEPDWPMLRFYLGVSRLQLGFPLAAAGDLAAAAEAGFDPPGGMTEWWWGLAQLYCGNMEDGYRLLTQVANSDDERAPQAQIILDRLQDTEIES